MFVRTKRVKKGEYAYLVKNVWTEQGSRQQIIRYLGAVFRPRKMPYKVQLSISSNASVLGVLNDLIRRELQLHGFENKGKVWVNGGVTVEPGKARVRFRGRRATVKLNEGFLCDETIKGLRKLFLGEKIDGKQLAEAVLEAGICVSPEEFVELYNLLRPYK